MKQILILCSEFNLKISESLLAGAKKELLNTGLSEQNIQIEWVPGAFELPTAASMALETNQYSAIICLGAVIKGETPHFEVVAYNCAQRISELGVKYKRPVIFGVLTTNNAHQALVRAGLRDNGANSGEYYARAVIKMLSLEGKLQADKLQKEIS